MELTKESPVLFSAIVSGAQDAIISQTCDGTIMSWNAGAERIFGYTEKETLGRSVYLLPVKPHVSGLLSGIEQLRRGNVIPPYEDQFYRKDGEIIPVSVALSPLYGKARDFLGISLIIRPLDTKPIKVTLNHADNGYQLQDPELLHLSRLSAAGKMAVAFAHELNQPLTALSLYLSAAKRLLRAQDIGQEATLTIALDRASEQTHRAAETLQRLRRFVSKDNQRQSLFIAKTITEASELALILARNAGVTVEFQLDADAVVSIDPVQIEQVLFNLIRNAIEAMHETSSPRIFISTAWKEDKIVISVADTGPGLSSEVADRLFEPLVTTKTDGFGMGLAICMAIISAHDGEIWHEASEGHGAVFCFKLPVPLADGTF
jgi:two-component system sensor kinase FixL